MNTWLNSLLHNGLSVGVGFLAPALLDGVSSAITHSPWLIAHPDWQIAVGGIAGLVTRDLLKKNPAFAASSGTIAPPK